MLVPFATAILLKLSPALTVTVAFLAGVLLELVASVLTVVFGAPLEPESFKT